MEGKFFTQEEMIKILEKSREEDEYGYGLKYEVHEIIDCIFESTTDTSSATICRFCGKEKFLHKQ